MIEMIYSILLPSVILITTIIVHELGHIVPFYYYNKKFPTMSMNKWLLISCGKEDEYKNMTFRQYTIVAYSGYLVGLIYLIITTNTNWFYLFLYQLMSSYDITIYCNFIQSKNEFRDVKIRRLKTIITG